VTSTADISKVPGYYRKLARLLIDDGFQLLHGATHLYVIHNGRKVGTLPRHSGSNMKPDALLRRYRRRAGLE
jgi:hypothetical protein